MQIIVRKPMDNELKEAKKWPVWEKEPSTFDYEYDERETCYIIEGRAEVRTAKETAKFSKGDYVIFPKGLKCTWTISEKIRKNYRFG
jgi:uncharacterized protein